MKYIDAEKLIERLEEMKQAEYENCGGVNSKTGALQEVQELIESLQEEQTDDVCSVIKEFYEKELPFEDEKTRAAYHFFSAGRAFELKKIEEERVKHITDLLDNYQRGKKAGYKEAIFELKERKIECSPVMKELIDKLFGVGNTFNFGFGPKDLLQEQPEVDLEKFTEKIKTFQERYKYPEIVSIKGAMAFMARMFYQYPNVARQWYDSLPKATMD